MQKGMKSLIKLKLIVMMISANGFLRDLLILIHVQSHYMNISKQLCLFRGARTQEPKSSSCICMKIVQKLQYKIRMLIVWWTSKTRIYTKMEEDLINAFKKILRVPIDRTSARENIDKKIVLFRVTFKKSASANHW